MSEEEFEEACKRLDKAGIPYMVIRDICLERECDETEAKALLKGLTKNEAQGPE